MHMRLFTGIVVAVAATMRPCPRWPRTRTTTAPSNRRSSVGRCSPPTRWPPGRRRAPPLGPASSTASSSRARSSPSPGSRPSSPGRQPGEYLAMPDNGFGAKANSADFLIRAYYVRPDFKTARGGSGTVEVDTDAGRVRRVPRSRPPDRVPHRQRGHEPDRLLTGADIDPESLQRGSDGDLWVGDEFGPWILHFDATGRLLDPPFATPGGLMSPSNPFLGGNPPTQPNSRGYEAMAISPNGALPLRGARGRHGGRGRLHAPERLRVQRPGRGLHRAGLELPDRAARRTWWPTCGPSTGHRLVVIERDGGRGLAAIVPERVRGRPDARSTAAGPS